MPRVEHLVAAVLDTHVWVWCAAGDRRASALKRFQGRMIVPAISLWELAMLHGKGRVILEPDVESWIEANLVEPVTLEPLSPQIAAESCRLPGDFHGDPADRLIVATAGVLGVPLLTADSRILSWNRKTRYLVAVAP